MKGSFQENAILDKEEKKQVRADGDALSKLIMRAKSEKMMTADISDIKNAIEKLKQSGAHVCELTENSGGEEKK